MAAHTYWRLNFAGTDGGSTLTLGEVELRTAVGGVSVTANMAALDSSAAAHTLSFNGGATKSAVQSKFGGSALDMTAGGAGDGVSTPDSADWSFGAGQFTIEGFVRFTSLPAGGCAFVSQFGNSPQQGLWFGLNGPTAIAFFYSTTGINLLGTPVAWTPTLNTWYHVAVDRDASNVIRVYVDGVIKGSVTDGSTFVDNTAALWIGNDSRGASRNLPGYIDEVRVTKGVARYAGAFTPPSAAFPDSVGAGDASFASVVLLSHFDNPSGDTAAASTGTAPNAFDANNASNWALSSGTVGWIQYQFTIPQDIIEHTVTAPAATMTNAPNRWTLQYSDDGANWTTAAIVGGQTGWTTNEKRVFTHSSYPVAIGRSKPLPIYLPVVTSTPPAASVRATLRNEAGLQTSPMITGVVKQNGVAVARTVRAYCRLTGEILGSATSDAVTGIFSINARGRLDYCYVIALDDLTSSPDYNCAVFDLVIPV